MIRRIVRYLVVIGVTFLIMYTLHITIADAQELGFSILSIYIFNVTSSLVTYGAVELVFSKIPNQAGYAFLAAVFLKLGVFTILFTSIFDLDRSLTMLEKASILFPFGIFLVIEAVFCSQLLNTAKSP